jgi:hypothetical protein
LVDDGPISGRRNRLAFLTCRLEPGVASPLDLRQGLLRCGTEGRTQIKVGDVGDIAASSSLKKMLMR